MISLWLVYLSINVRILLPIIIYNSAGLCGVLIIINATYGPMAGIAVRILYTFYKSTNSTLYNMYMYMYLIDTFIHLRVHALRIDCRASMT